MGPEVGLRGVVMFVDQSRDDGPSADGPQVGHVQDGLRHGVRRAAAAGTGAALWRHVLAGHQGQVALIAFLNPTSLTCASQQSVR
jgi:hypothetical protein